MCVLRGRYWSATAKLKTHPTYRFDWEDFNLTMWPISGQAAVAPPPHPISRHRCPPLLCRCHFFSPPFTLSFSSHASQPGLTGTSAIVCCHVKTFGCAWLALGRRSAAQTTNICRLVGDMQKGLLFFFFFLPKGDFDVVERDLHDTDRCKHRLRHAWTVWPATV